MDKRLPDNPYVLPHLWVKPGKYGGMLNIYTFASQGTAKADSNREYFYGHSLLRYLNDGLDIGPGWSRSGPRTATRRCGPSNSGPG